MQQTAKFTSPPRSLPQHGQKKKSNDSDKFTAFVLKRKLFPHDTPFFVLGRVESKAYICITPSGGKHCVTQFYNIMRQCYFLLLLLLGLASCSSQFNIDGNSSLACLDGKKLYLRSTRTKGDSNKTTTIDSCVVVHGRFSFGGTIDSIALAEIYVGDEHLMPVVLEGGQLLLQVDNYAQTITGGPLNDRLSDFMGKRARFDNELWEIDRTANRMFFSGIPMARVMTKMEPKRKAILRQIEQLEINFILDNANNILGEGYFLMLTEQQPFPVMTRQLEEIVEKAPATFRKNPKIRHYLLAAGYLPSAGKTSQRATAAEEDHHRMSKKHHKHKPCNDSIGTDSTQQD